MIDAALAILTRRLREPAAALHSAGAARELVRLHLARCERERFGVLFLDAQHAAIAWEVLFEGTVSQTAVFPREIVRRAVQLNASAVILAHNHPSGTAEPSLVDERLTAQIQQALWLIDVRVLDHLVIGWPGMVSMAERGLMWFALPSWPAPVAPQSAAKRRGRVSRATEVARGTERCSPLSAGASGPR